MNWYKKAQSYSRVKKRQYIKFHKELLMGIQDEDLLFDMIEDLRISVKNISQNSEMRNYYEHGTQCPNCQDYMDWVDEDGDKCIQSGCESGYWECSSCGNVLGFDEYFEKNSDSKGNWIYSDLAERLVNNIVNIDNTKDFGMRHAYFESTLEMIHGRGSMSEWMIEGGDNTIDYVRNMSNELV